jgi:hypothetical protein
VRTEFGLRDGRFRHRYRGGTAQLEGHQHLIEAAAQLQRQGAPVKLLIVGAGPQEGNLRRMIHDNGLDGIAIMTGYRQDVPVLMKAMQCLALPSTDNEATSQVLPQAMAMKVPVIATDVGGLAEVVINHDTGLLVPPRDTNALAAAIRWIYEHPQEARQMAERGYDHALANFTFDRMIERTEAGLSRCAEIKAAKPALIQASDPWFRQTLTSWLSTSRGSATPCDHRYCGRSRPRAPTASSVVWRTRSGGGAGRTGVGGLLGTITETRRWCGWFGGKKWDYAIVYGRDAPLIRYAARGSKGYCI